MGGKAETMVLTNGDPPSVPSVDVGVSGVSAQRFFRKKKKLNGFVLISYE